LIKYLSHIGLEALFPAGEKLLMGHRAKSLAILLIRTIQLAAKTSILELYMDATLKLVQLNIERSKHLDLVVPFLKAQNADVVCLQEFMERDMALFEKELQMKLEYRRCCDHPGDNPKEIPGIMGLAILSKHPLMVVSDKYYFGQSDPLIKHTPGIPGTTANPLLVCDIEKGGTTFRIATTHFTVALGGGVNELQRDHLQKMFAILERQGEFVLAGDFNAPRGGEIFSKLAEKYTDNIPKEYTTSIDGTMHRAGTEKLKADAEAMGFRGLMVDGIFSTPGYSVSNVAMHTGVSDHCAFTADISKS
jgi:endonuclease/exonuclease/phosphatase family metal-dependent hydrolase